MNPTPNPAPQDTEAPPSTGFKGVLDRYFQVSARRSNFAREIRGGLATFFAMAYIIVLNPLILGTAEDMNGDVLGGVRVAAVTSLVAGALTILMGVVGRYPFALAAGMGLNAVVAYTLAPQMTWADAMGLVVLEGLILLVLVLTGFRSAVFRAIPPGLKTAIAVGLGLFLALVGFVNAGFIRRVPDAAGSTVPVQLGEGGLSGWPILVFVVGLLLTVILMVRKVKGALLIGIIASTVFAIAVEALVGVGPMVDAEGDYNPTGWALAPPVVPDSVGAVVQPPDFSLIGQFNLFGSFEHVGVIAAILLMFTLLLADFFDTMGTMVGVAGQADLLAEDGDLPGARNVLVVDSLAAAAGGAASASSATVYAESAAGAGEGARTGFASVVTGVLFLVATLFSPLVTLVPFEAATPVLIVVGFLMMTQVTKIDFSDYGVAIPAFLTIVIMPFSFSIANGIGAGFVSYAVVRIAQGRAREIHPLMWIIAAAFLAYFALDPIRALLGV
ncbi:AGZA family xanthine/uracil permease-like MFS transporter [Spinactinospora alkalitolerans]|uniref:AGZA family xanthine/uracil permease-like MFS transporter n=1 Tax=Spinactinospora alkalitolerans TaxID=687207 RepID=A0A852TR89_9ACTN|nr:NCS2 family permease [Spinactinospora alkalitolerans]NYE45183.1 AGZA family xanthine/uracil permease-like MFS transporter [Spinactinospora alkalitolerans]